MKPFSSILTVLMFIASVSVHANESATDYIPLNYNSAGLDTDAQKAIQDRDADFVENQYQFCLEPRLDPNLDIDFVFTAFINSISLENLENYLVELKEVFQKQKVFITGWQLKIQSPKLPRNVKVVKDYVEFKKFLG